MDAQVSGPFDILKKYLIESSILKYHDPEKPYTLFTDASQYVWVCDLTQAYSHTHHIHEWFIYR